MAATLHAQDFRNVALVGHGAVGKTTLADQMLFRAGIGSRAGSVVASFMPLRVSGALSVAPTGKISSPAAA